MNKDLNGLQRSPGEFVLFGMVFVGLVLGGAGVILTSIPAAVTGLGLVLLGMSYFLLCSH
jgi:hypothetical protein